MIISKARSRQVNQFLPSRQGLHPLGPAVLPQPFYNVTTGRNSYIGKVADDIDHPKEIWKFYQIYRLDNETPPIELTGGEAFQIFAYNITQVTIKAGTMCMIVQVDGDPDTADRNHFVYPLPLQACLDNLFEPPSSFAGSGTIDPTVVIA